MAAVADPARVPVVKLHLLILSAALALAACTAPQVLNTLTPERGYDIATNLPYDDRTPLKLDVYSPRGAKGAPVVVFFYGGRWSSGAKDEFKFVGQALASRGFIGVVPDVRLYPEVRFPQFLGDAARAVRWVRSEIPAYGGDPAKLFVMGHSSGAHIAAMLALNEEYLKDVGGSRTWLRGMIGLAGAYDFLPITAPDLRDLFGPPESFARTQPVFWVDGQNPPLLLLHGEDDEVVQVKNTRSLAQAVARRGGTVETVIYPRMSHNMIVGSLGAVLRGQSDVLGQIAQFVSREANAPPGARRTDIRATPLPEDFRTQPLTERP